jgi:hypothetical protein
MGSFDVVADVGREGGEADFSAALLTRARTASVEMTVPWWGKITGNINCGSEFEV